MSVGKFLDKEIEMLMMELQGEDNEKKDLMIHTIQSMRFLNNALKHNRSKILNILLALDESAEIHWSKDGDIIHASIYHLIPRRQLMNLELKVIDNRSACIMKTEFL